MKCSFRQSAEIVKLGCPDVFMDSGGKSNFLLAAQPNFEGKDMRNVPTLLSYTC